MAAKGDAENVTGYARFYRPIHFSSRMKEHEKILG